MTDFLVDSPYGGAHRIPHEVWDVPTGDEAIAGILSTIADVEALQRKEWTEAGVPGYETIESLGEVALADRQIPGTVVE